MTATLEEKTVAAIRRAAGPRGVSAFLETAARQRLARPQLLALLDERSVPPWSPESSWMLAR